ncbi:hypothetical protein J9303_07475 [Bacillaceae bacterium Marseille-Q3522]|nr:hypothetical protein [Bacillaceae bacterium Marseille-Q3522]
MDNQEKTLKNFISGMIGPTVVGNLIIGSLMSAIPVPSLTIFLMVVIIICIEVIMNWVWFKKIESKQQYVGLTSFLPLITSGFFATIPLMRITYGSILFIIVLLLYLTVFVFTLYKRKLILYSFENIRHSWLAKGAIFFILVVLVIGSMSARNGQELLILAHLNTHQDAIFISIIGFAIGLFFTFISVIVIKQPDKIKKQ